MRLRDFVFLARNNLECTELDARHHLWRARLHPQT